jgi:hypothetical protein
MMHEDAWLAIWKAMGAGVIACALASCGAFKPLKVEKLPPPKTMQEGVELNAVAVYSKSWPELIDSLSPKFGNTPDGALAQVDQVQSFADNRFLNAMGIGAQAGVQFGPQISSSDETTRSIASNDASGTTVVSKDDTSRTITTKRESSNASPELPAASAGAGGGRSATSLPDLIGATRNPSTEPFFRYSAANALYQEIALINDAVAGIPAFRDTKPYIVRLRVSVKPYRRDLPWDLYAHFTLFEDQPNGSKPVIVLPILSTESYQGTIDASALQQVLDLRLSLQAAVSNAKAGASFDKLNDQLTSFLTRRYESTLHVGGASGRSLQVKFGAARDKTGFALEDRDHFVTIVAYLKPPYRDEDPRSYRFYMDYEARNSETGVPVTDNSQAFYEKVAPVVARLGLVETDIRADSVARPTETLTETQGGTKVDGPAQLFCDPKIGRLLFNFADDIGLYDGRRAILNLAECFKPSYSRNAVLANALYLVSKVTNARTLASDTSFSFDIKPLSVVKDVTFNARAAPQVQVTRKAFTVAVPYAGDLDLEKVTALLTPDADAKAGAFEPRTIALKTTGPVSQIVMDFPPLASMQFDSLPATVVTKLKEPAGWDICVAVAPQDVSDCPTTVPAPAAVVPGVYMRALSAGYSKASAADQPSFALSTPTQSVKQAADGTVTFGVYVEPPQGLPVKLTVTGGELVVGGAATQEIAVTTKGMVSLTVRNSTPGGLVVVHGLSVSTTDVDAKTTKDLSIAVQAGAAAPQNK